MAAVTHAVTTPDTGNTPNASGAFTPAVGDLLIVFVGVEASLNDPGVLTGTGAGLTFTQVRRQLYQSSAASFYVFVANALVSAASSQTVQIESGGDAGAGSNISVLRVSGMVRVGLAAIRQSAGQSNTAAGTPAPSFGAAALTANACLGAIANATNPAGLVQPASWSESSDTGYTTGQVNGIETAFRNSGETGTTITWGGASASAFASLVVELDTSIPPFNPTRRARLHRTSGVPALGASYGA